MSIISSATVRNWERLGTDGSEKLTKRANKLRSQKRIIPYEYISDKNNISLLETIINEIIDNAIGCMDSIYTLCFNQLKKYGIHKKETVTQAFKEYKCSIAECLTNFTLPDNEFDFIGAIYQSLLLEGSKNSMGSYYTPQKISAQMTDNLDFSSGQRFFDPCCGSGSFLLSLNCDSPDLIYGSDNDPIAVMIAKTNLLCKYSNIDFIPHVYCMDFLETASLSEFTNEKFDYICSNPPWGAVTGKTDIPFEIKSNESFSIFFVKSFFSLKPEGLIRFLFPESILNVKAHRDIRSFMLNCCSLKGIRFYRECFTGVLTSYVDISARNSSPEKIITVVKDGESYCVNTDSFSLTKNLVFGLLKDIDISIIEKVRAVSPYNLSQSIWALGIVTGNNKEKLSDVCMNDMEPIYTGKEISGYSLKPARKYIHYDRNLFQQAAADEIYRSDEKLVYKFISDRLVFSYDDSQSLFLNSANILIPSIPGMSVKTVMAFLNSELYSFLYQKLFGEIKVLKGNLIELPFPEISEETNMEIEQLTDSIITSQDNSLINILQNKIYELFYLNDEEVQYIKSQIK